MVWAKSLRNAGGASCKQKFGDIPSLEIILMKTDLQSFLLLLQHCLNQNFNNISKTEKV